jgi:hypothetical protein
MEQDTTEYTRAALRAGEDAARERSEKIPRRTTRAIRADAWRLMGNGDLAGAMALLPKRPRLRRAENSEADGWVKLADEILDATDVEPDGDLIEDLARAFEIGAEGSYPLACIHALVRADADRT